MGRKAGDSFFFLLLSWQIDSTLVRGNRFILWNQCPGRYVQYNCKPPSPHLQSPEGQLGSTPPWRSGSPASNQTLVDRRGEQVGTVCEPGGRRLWRISGMRFGGFRPRSPVLPGPPDRSLARWDDTRVSKQTRPLIKRCSSQHLGGVKATRHPLGEPASRGPHLNGGTRGFPGATPVPTSTAQSPLARSLRLAPSPCRSPSF